jgi:hypothetical protein
VNIKLVGLFFIAVIFVSALALIDRSDLVAVYKYDGSRQCAPNSGFELNEMAAQLKGKGIPVYSSTKATDGRMYPSVCGAGTGRINIYEIDPLHLESAKKLGFQLYSPPLY